MTTTSTGTAILIYKKAPVFHSLHEIEMLFCCNAQFKMQDRDLSGEEARHVKKLLRSHVTFAALSKRAVEEIVKKMHVHMMKNGAILHDLNGVLLIVKSGSLDVCVMATRTKVMRLSKDEVYGESRNVIHNTSIIAAKHSCVYLLEKTDLIEGLYQTPTPELNEIIMCLSKLPELRTVADIPGLAAMTQKYIFNCGQWVIKPGRPSDTDTQSVSVVYSGVVTLVNSNRRLFQTDCYGKLGYSLQGEVAGVMAERDHTVILKFPFDGSMVVKKKPQDFDAHAHVVVNGKVCVGRAGEIRGLEGHETSIGEPRLELAVKKHIGRGAYGIVTHVIDKEVGNNYAMKSIAKSDVIHGSTRVKSENSIGKMVTSPYCVQHCASFMDNRHLYILMDLVDGCDLGEVIAKHRRKITVGTAKVRICLSELVAKYYVAAVAHALEHLHDQHIIYRDLKPENVMISALGHAKLGDYGFAKQLGKRGRAFTFCGTPGYIAPEVMKCGASGYSYEADWWSLGVLMYVMLVGRNPFAMSNQNRALLNNTANPGFVVFFPPYMSAEAKHVIQGLLRYDPVTRFGYAELQKLGWVSEGNMKPPLSGSAKGVRGQQDENVMFACKAAKVIRKSIDNSLFKDF